VTLVPFFEVLDCTLEDIIGLGEGSIVGIAMKFWIKPPVGYVDKKWIKMRPPAGLSSSGRV
jgi:hypothetical protein